MEGTSKWTAKAPPPSRPGTRSVSSPLATPMVSTSAGKGFRPRSAAPSRHVTRIRGKGERGTMNGNSKGPNPNPAPIVHWFEHVDLHQPASESLASSSSLSTVDSDLRAHEFPRPLSVSSSAHHLEAIVPRSTSEVDLRHLLRFHDSELSMAAARGSSSGVGLADLTEVGSLRDSISTLPSNLGVENSPRPVTRSPTGKSERRPWPGRYKVKVLEQKKPPKKRGRKQGSVFDPNSPYRGEAFIDVDGGLKLGGKAFEAYITRPQYRLLKDIYAPGMIASRVPPIRRTKESRAASVPSGPSSSSRSPRRVRSPAVAPAPADPTSKSPNSNVIKSRNSLLAHSRPRGRGQSLTNLGMETRDKEQQTAGVVGVDEETQTTTTETRPRRTVEFDLEHITVQAYEPDDDDDDSASNKCLTSDMGFLGLWDDADDRDGDYEATTPNPDTEEEFLQHKKMITAVQMAAAIVTAQKAGKESLASPLVLQALEHLSPDELEGVMATVVSDGAERERSLVDVEDEKDSTENQVEALHNLMDLYNSAYTYILGHIRAADAYDARFPDGRGKTGSSLADEVKDPTSPDLGQRAIPKVLPREAAGDTNVEEKECGVYGSLAVVDGDLDDGSVAVQEQPAPASPNPPYMRYTPEMTSAQLKVQLHACPEHLSQNIRVRDVALEMNYGLRGVSTILRATRAKEAVIPVSTGNLLLIHNQHATLVASRIISSKFFLNRVVHQLMTLGEYFLVGKYAKLSSADTASIHPKVYHRLREINVFSGILFQLSNSFVFACKKILDSLQHVAKFEPLTRLQSVTVIGRPTQMAEDEFTVPTTGVFPADEAYGPLLAAFDEIDSIILTGSTSLQGLNQRGGGGVKVRQKYYKTIVTFMEAAKQLERGGRELDFGAVLVGWVVDLMLLQRLQGKPGEPALDTPQKAHLWTTYHEVQYLLQELTKLGKKATLISSFATSKTTAGLRKYRDSQERNFGCFRGMLMSCRKKKEEGLEEEIGDKEACEEFTLEMDTLEQDKSRLIQMLRAISNESSLSFSIF